MIPVHPGTDQPFARPLEPQDGFTAYRYLIRHEARDDSLAAASALSQRNTTNTHRNANTAVLSLDRVEL
jgi:hypothetical protein